MGLPLCVVECVERDLLIGDRIEMAEGFGSKGKGLLGRTGLEEGQGLFLSHTTSIHMFFMLFPIDVVYLAEPLTTSRDEVREMIVRKVARAVPPWWMSWAGFTGADHTLELPANLPELDELEIGDTLVFSPAD